MATFCITAVRYSANKDHIELVKVREELPEKIGAEQIVPRAFVAALIRRTNTSFITRFKTPEGLYKTGADVVVLEDIYLTTDKNSRKRDNLGELPTF